MKPLFLLLGLAAATQATSAGPLVIAHRGASGERPEHTLAAYRLAIDQGADFIEADVVSTRDGVLVARHENEIGGTTNVADHPEFADRRTTKTIDRQPITGWFTEDFTLAELKTLRARERLRELRSANLRFTGEPIATLQEALDLVRARRRDGRRVGIYIETKHPSYFRAIGLPIEQPLVAALDRAGLRRRSDPVFIESFEVGNLQRLRGLTRVKLVQLMEAAGHPADQTGSYRSMANTAGLKAIARYADAIGPEKAMIVPRDTDGRSLPATTLVSDAHAAGLLVHPWTFRSENAFLPGELRAGTAPSAPGRSDEEYRQFRLLGVDGFFTDFPGHAVAALRSRR